MFNLSFNDSNFYKGQNNEDLLVMGAIGGEVILKSKPVKCKLLKVRRLLLSFWNFSESFGKFAQCHRKAHHFVA